jgi:hypothetical protein
MRVGVSAFVSLLGLVVAFGCSSSSDDTELEGGSIAIDDAPELIATAACSAFDECWGAGSPLVFGAEECETRVENSFRDSLDVLAAAQAAGSGFYDGKKMQKCIDAIAAAKCGIDEALESDVCKSAVDGLIDLGNACINDFECKGDAYCASTSTCPGTCTAAGSTGDSCTRNNECATGFYCSDTNKKCTKPAAAGDVCGGATGPNCDDGFFCLGADEDTGQSGNCRAFDEVFTAEVGETCSPQGPFCVPSARCGIMAVTPSLQLECIATVASGAACRLSFPESCPNGEYCKVVPDTLEGTCTALPAVGEACAVSGLDADNLLCAPYARCETGTCRALQNLGGACQEADTCYSEACVGGVCAAAGTCE